MTLIDKIREAVFRDPPVIRKQAADNPTEVVGGIEVFKMGAKLGQPLGQPPRTAYGQNRRHRGR